MRYATLTVNGGTISGNSVGESNRGGGIYCSSYGKVVLTGGVISGNTAPTGSGIFFSSRTNANAELYIGGETLVTGGDNIYLDNASNTTKFPYITSAIKNVLPLVTNTHTEDRVLAQGSGYTLTEADMAKITIAVSSSETPYYAKLDSAKNQLLMTATDPGYTSYYNVSYFGNGGTGSVTDNENYTSGAAVTVKDNGFTRTGYGFNGWNTAADGSETAYAPGDSFNITADTRLYAQWLAGRYPVTYALTQLTANGAATATHETAYTATLSAAAHYKLPATITVQVAGNTLTAGTDYTYSATTGAIAINAEKVTGAIAITAAGVVERYTVTFESNEGSTVPPITDVAAGSTITAPTDPTKTEYDFVGWYKETGLTNQWNFNTDTVDGSITLYAKWTLNTSDVAFSSLTANGSDTASTTELTLTFNKDVAGLAIDDITVSGATKGTLTKESGTGIYKLTVSNITVADGETVNVAIAKTNFTFTPTNKDVAVRVYTPPVYSISATPEALTFGSVYTGYTQPDTQTVTVTNTGNQSVTVDLPTLENYTVAAGTGFSGTTATIEANGTATFTVQPNASLGANIYNGTLSIVGSNGVSDTVSVSFTVTSPPPTVTSVTISPATASVEKGSAQTFTATIIGTYNPARTVTWTVEGGNGSTIDANGSLTVAATETATVLTVRATSTVDTTKSGTATVTVLAPTVAFSSLVANGSDTASTTELTLIFNKDVAGLAIDDITVSGATKGTLTKESGTGIYKLTVSNITVADGETVNVAIAKTNFTFTPTNKDVAVRVYTPSITLSPSSSITQGAAPDNLMLDIGSTNGELNITYFGSLEISTDGTIFTDVQSDKYTLTNGSIHVALHQDYLNALAVGDYPFRVNLLGKFAGAAPTATLTVLNSPTAIILTGQPTDQSVVVGQQATFSVSATGDDLTYRWQINRNDGRGWQDLSGTTGTSHTTTAVTLENDHYQYRCQITDAHGNTQTTDVAALHVSSAIVPPRTGDSNKPWPWLGLCLLSGLGLILTMKKRQRA